MVEAVRQSNQQPAKLNQILLPLLLVLLSFSASGGQNASTNRSAATVSFSRQQSQTNSSNGSSTSAIELNSIVQTSNDSAGADIDQAQRDSDAAWRSANRAYSSVKGLFINIFKGLVGSVERVSRWMVANAATVGEALIPTISAMGTFGILALSKRPNAGIKATGTGFGVASVCGLWSFISEALTRSISLSEGVNTFAEPIVGFACLLIFPTLYYGCGNIFRAIWGAAFDK